MDVYKPFMPHSRCGCVIQQRHSFTISSAREAEIRAVHPGPAADAILHDMRVTGDYDEIAIERTILSQCEDHQQYATAEDLFTELQQQRGAVLHPDCGCVLAFWSRPDKGPDRHPVKMGARRCEDHAHLDDHEEHFHAVLSEVQARTWLSHAIAMRLNLDPMHVWRMARFDWNRAIVFEGIDPAIVAEARQTLTQQIAEDSTRAAEQKIFHTHHAATLTVLGSGSRTIDPQVVRSPHRRAMNLSDEPLEMKKKTDG